MRVKLPGIENQTKKYLPGANLSSKQGEIAIFDIHGFWPPIWPQYRGSNVKKWGSNTPGVKYKYKNESLVQIWGQYNENWPCTVFVSPPLVIKQSIVVTLSISLMTVQKVAQVWQKFRNVFLANFINFHLFQTFVDKNSNFKSNLNHWWPGNFLRCCSLL